MFAPIALDIVSVVEFQAGQIQNNFLTTVLIRKSICHYTVWANSKWGEIVCKYRRVKNNKWGKNNTI